MPDSAPVSFGQPMLPDPARIAALMAEAIAAGWLTNGGVLHARLERALASRLGGGTVALVSSGTMALMMALRLGGLPEGAEVITPPISFAATVQAVRWCGFRPVFADVEPDSLTLCPRAVEAAITPRTAAILGVHLMGVPCDVTALEQIARRHKLWLVYDAAHCFGLTLNQRHIAEWGDASAFSLHATKLLHTGEGGAVVLPQGGGMRQVSQMRNFGLALGRTVGPGINGKLSEAQAAVGLALLPGLEAEIAARQRLRALYDAAFEGLPGITVHRTRQSANESVMYYALRLCPDLAKRLLVALAEAGILARGPFPLLCGPGTCLPEAPIITAAATPVAPRVGPEVLCLPLHGRVSARGAERIVSVVRDMAASMG